MKKSVITFATAALLLSGANAMAAANTVAAAPATPAAPAALATPLASGTSAPIAAPMGQVATAGASTSVPAPPAKLCETAVTAAIQKSRAGQAKQVQFVAAKRSGTPTSSAPDSAPQGSLQGQGSYQGEGGTMPFTYSCTLDAQAREVTGVIFKETGAPAHRAEKPWQADLAHISPETCDAGAAASVREKFPRAARVVLSSRTRQLSAAPNGQTYLHGQGTLERASGMPPSAFTYRCEMNTSTGKLMGVLVDMVE